MPCDGFKWSQQIFDFYLLKYKAQVVLTYRRLSECLSLISLLSLCFADSRVCSLMLLKLVHLKVPLVLFTVSFGRSLEAVANLINNRSNSIAEEVNLTKGELTRLEDLWMLHRSINLVSHYLVLSVKNLRFMNGRGS